MHRTLFAQISALSLLSFIFPIAALADLNQTTTLQSNSRLNLDTGAVPSSGGDLLWNGLTITPQGNAKAFNLGDFSSIFDSAPKAYYDSFKIVATSAPIAASLLVPGDVFAAFTNGGNTAGVMVTAKSGSSITLRFITFIPVIPTGPTITAIQNNSSRIPTGYPNYGIAPSSLFVVLGTGLADPSALVLESTAPPGLPLTLHGASITVVVAGVTTHPALYYASPTQISAVLPAATPVGTGTLTVTYNGAVSAAASILVVPSAVGINYFSQLGVNNSNVNVGVAQDLSGAILTFTNSGSPGQTITLWITGLGADPDDSDTTYTSTPHRINTPLQVYFGGVLATTSYQGSAGYPGVQIINLQIPLTVPIGCYVPLVVVTGNIISNVVNFPIHQGGGTCVEPTTGANGTQILQNTQDTLRSGLVSLVQTNAPSGGTRTVTNSANANFQKYTGLLASATGQIMSPGGCVVGPIIGASVPSLEGLEAGTITLTGPAGLAVTLSPQLGLKGYSGATLAAGAIPASGGTFTFHGSGGTDVGSFTTAITLSSPLLSWTNMNVAATIDKTQGVQVTWTGGNPGTYVVISGTSTKTPATNPPIIAGFTCRIAVEAGQFTVPAYILLGLPAGTGGTLLQNDVISTFSATGLDSTYAGATISSNVASTFR
jgi:uncharacterized protein (TIGR03437 family)